MTPRKNVVDGLPGTVFDDVAEILFYAGLLSGSRCFDSKYIGVKPKLEDHHYLEYEIG